MIFEITNEFLVRLLIFVLTLFVVFVLMNKFFENKAVATIIGLSIALLAAFYLSYDNIRFLGEVYGGIGALILILIPWFIAFFFIYSINVASALRRIFWLFFGFMTIVLTQNRQFFFQNIEDWILVIVILATSVLIIFDKKIKERLDFSKIKKGLNKIR